MRERMRIWAAVGAGLVLLLTACDASAGAPRGQSEPTRAPGGSSSSEEAGTTPASSTDETTEEPEEATESAGEAESAEDAAEPESEPEPTAAEGSRENPFLIGDDIGNDDWSIVLDQPYEAWDEVRAENQFNDPPDEGMEFWMLPITVTYIGLDTDDPFWDLDFGFVGEDGRTYDGDCGVIPEELWDVGDMYPDAEASANVCLAVPEDAPGLWTVAATFTDPVFFTGE